jgi:hypothetical protein
MRGRFHLSIRSRGSGFHFAPICPTTSPNGPALDHNKSITIPIFADREKPADHPK